MVMRPIRRTSRSSGDNSARSHAVRGRAKSSQKGVKKMGENIPRPPGGGEAVPRNRPLNGVSEGVEAGLNGTNLSRGPGVKGSSDAGDGVIGEGATNGVVGRSRAAAHSGVWADN